MGDSMKRRIAEATLSRVEETGDFEGLSVSRLADDLGVSRTSFYRNFRDKFDLIDWIFDHLVVLPVTRGESVDDYPLGDYRELTVCSLEIIRRHRTFFQSILDYRGQNAFVETYFKRIADDFRRRLAASGEGSVRDETDVRFHTAGVVQVVEDWLREGCRESPEVVASVLVEVVPARLQTSLKKDRVPEGHAAAGGLP